MEKRMSRFGIGPKWAAISLCYGTLTIVLHLYSPEVFRMDIIPFLPRIIAGSLLIILGLVMYASGIKAVMSAYNAKKLATGGILSLCRNPIYAAWAVFIIPGAMLLANSWICLTLCPVMYVSLRIMIRKEEEYLEAEFGDEYRAYKKRVPAIFPLGRLACTS